MAAAMDLQLRRLCDRRACSTRTARRRSRSATARCAGRAARAGRRHDGAMLAAVRHPTAAGVISGGDDGRLVWSRPDERPDAGRGRRAAGSRAWRRSRAPASSPSAAGREARVLDLADPAFARVFAHERSVADVALDAQGPAPGGGHLRRRGALVRPHRRPAAGDAALGRLAHRRRCSARTASS